MNNLTNTRFQVIAAVLVKIQVFWTVKATSAGSFRRFRRSVVLLSVGSISLLLGFVDRTNLRFS